MARGPSGANDIQAAGTTALCEGEIGPPLRHRNARFGKDGRALEVSRLEEGVVVDFAIPFDSELPASLRDQSRRPEG